MSRSPQQAVLLAAILVTAMMAVVAPVLAQQTDSFTLPAPPEGYRTERIGSVTWTFPEALQDRVLKLIDGFDEHWNEVVSELGVPVDDELVIRVARNPQEMSALAPVGSPPPDYATGVAYPPWGVILLSMSAPQSWEPPDLEVVLVHELSHVAFYRAVLGHDVPRWFSEGLAIQQSEVRLLPRMESLLRAAAQRSILRLSELDQYFPRRPYDVNLAYAQSADVVGFLRRSDSDERRFQRMVLSLRSGETFDTALAGAYGWTRAGLEREWRESLRTRYRILPALLTGSTVWVAAAVLVIVAYRRRRRYARLKLEQMAHREQLEALQAASQPPPAPIERSERYSEGGIPIVEHDGESHTLH